jgi:hypothetical protein
MICGCIGETTVIIVGVRSRAVGSQFLLHFKPPLKRPKLTNSPERIAPSVFHDGRRAMHLFLDEKRSRPNFLLVSHNPIARQLPGWRNPTRDA